MGMEIQNIPWSLLLLVHLHILEYPHANNPEYDPELFNPRIRGLRERPKTMEDIAYFLVGKIEGKGVKVILSTYPCAQPSDSLAFRTSLTKYLEGLRHQFIYPSSGKSGMKAASLKSSDSALWWKDTVVRKSLIEECSGEKFERLIVSLSTHALMKITNSIPPENIIKVLHTQPSVYINALAQYQAKRRSWTKAASLLTGSEYDLKSLHESLKEAAPSKYSAYSTSRIQALAESKRQALLDDQWKGETGSNAFQFFVQLAGLKIPNARKAFSVADITVEEVLKPTGFLPPLPVAAAHHPAHLKRLRRALFSDRFIKTESEIHIPTQIHADLVLAQQFDSAKHMRQNLAEAISQSQRIGVQLRAKLHATSPRNDGQITPINKFWTRSTTSYKTINFNPSFGRNILLSLGIKYEYGGSGNDDAKEDALEKRIEQIRNSIIPLYPPMPDQTAPRKPALDQKPTKQAGLRGFVNFNAATSKIPQSKATALTKGASDQLSQHKSPTEPTPITSTSGLNPNHDAHTGPLPPSMTPSRSSRSDRRKSVHFSMAKRRSERPSMFRVFSGGLEDEVDRLVDETHDFPTDDEDTDDDGGGSTLSPMKTPRSKAKARPITNRIWTAGTPISEKRNIHATPKPRIPSALTRMLDMEPSLSLPGFPSSGSLQIEDYGEHVLGLGVEGDDNHDDDERGYEYDRPPLGDGEATPRPAKKALPRHLPEDTDPIDAEEVEDEDVFVDDPPSMTLKDILLSADTSHFDLLDASTDDMGEGMLVEDSSFVWE